MKLATTTIFKNDFIEVVFTGTATKEILVNATAENPADGKSYSKSAGWISKTWYLHSYAKTPGYIFEKAAQEFHDNLFKIAENLLTHSKKLHEKMYADWIENDCTEANAGMLVQSRSKTKHTIEINGRVEPTFGMFDVSRYAYKTMGENLELIKNEIEKNTYKKFPKDDFENNTRKVAR